jgi:hypothetical protein
VYVEAAIVCDPGLLYSTVPFIAPGIPEKAPFSCIFPELLIVPLLVILPVCAYTLKTPTVSAIKTIAAIRIT